MEIKRNAYLQQLTLRKDNGMIKVITGIRRCGKSFLLFTIFKRYLLENGVDVDHIIEIALDGIENEELRDPKVCFKYIKDVMKDDGKYYLLLDEVQFMPQFEEVLNSLLRMRNIDVYVTGSNSKFLSSDIVTEFRGRGDEIRIYPLSFAEFYSVYDGDYDDAWDDYMTYGGLPQIVSFQSERQKADYLKNIFANVYLKDVIERNKIQNVDEIGILIDVLASAIGAPTNPSKIANTFASERQMTYVCNECHTKGMDVIIDICLSETSKNPIEIIRRMMAQPFCHMHGPEHHVMVGSALLTAYKNAGGEIDLPEALLEMMNRGKAVPGGVCGFWGACGAGISTGIFISIISGATPLKNEPWGLANKMTSKALDAIGSIGGPRCCKRDSYIAIISAIDYVAENFNIQMEKPVIKCIHSDKNNQCIKERCPFHE